MTKRRRRHHTPTTITLSKNSLTTTTKVTPYSDLFLLVLTYLVSTTSNFRSCTFRKESLFCCNCVRHCCCCLQRQQEVVRLLLRSKTRRFSYFFTRTVPKIHPIQSADWFLIIVIATTIHPVRSVD